MLRDKIREKEREKKEIINIIKSNHYKNYKMMG